MVYKAVMWCCTAGLACLSCLTTWLYSSFACCCCHRIAHLVWRIRCQQADINFVSSSICASQRLRRHSGLHICPIPDDKLNVVLVGVRYILGAAVEGCTPLGQTAGPATVHEVEAWKLLQVLFEHIDGQQDGAGDGSDPNQMAEDEVGVGV